MNGTRDHEQMLDQLAMRYLDAVAKHDADALLTMWQEAESDRTAAKTAMFLALNEELARNTNATATDARLLRRLELFVSAHIDAQRVARLVGMGDRWEQMGQLLTPAERAEVLALWATLPGHTCFNDALRQWHRSV